MSKIYDCERPICMAEHDALLARALKAESEVGRLREAFLAVREHLVGAITGCDDRLKQGHDTGDMWSRAAYCSILDVLDGEIALARGDGEGGEGG